MARITTDEIRIMHQILEKHGAQYSHNKVIKGSWDTGTIPAIQDALKPKRKKRPSRQTVYNYIKDFPQKPKRESRKKVIPKKVREFEETEGWQKLKDHKYNKDIASTLFQAWEYLDKVDPITWTPEHIDALRKETYKDSENPLFLPETGDISPHNATNIRRAIKAWRLPNTQSYLSLLSNVSKAASGKRKEWYLEADDLKKLINEIKGPDTLIYLMKSIEDGSRPIATAGKTLSNGRPMPTEWRFTTDKIDLQRHMIRRYESKKKKWARAKYQTETLQLIIRYIKDMGIPDEADILPYNQKTYSDRISKAGLKAGIPLFKKKGSGAYVLRHTFATQALFHNVSLEAVMEQGGWKTADVIMGFYAGLKEEKLDYEFLDIPIPKKMTWKEWILHLSPAFKQQYEKILRDIIQGTKRPPKTEKKTVRNINWPAVEARIKSNKTPEPLRKSAEKAMALHRKGYTDAQVKKEMGWT